MRILIAVLLVGGVLTSQTDQETRRQQARAAVLQRRGAAPKAEPYQPEDGSFAVKTIESVLLRDKGRGGGPGMELELKIRYPEGTGPFPVIIFSGGGAGSKEGYAPLADYWASHGYVMLHPGHNTLRPIGVSKDGDAERQRSRKGEEIWSSRPRDVSFVIDSLDELERVQPELKGKLKRDAVACAGHSAGAYTTMRIGGAIAKLDGYPEDLRDQRVRALLVLSGQGRDQQGLLRNSWDNLRTPMLVVTGTRDRGATGGRLDWKMEPYTSSPPGDKYLIVLEGGEHNLGGISGQTAAHPDFLPGVKMASLAFFDAYLKDDPAAKRYLQSENIEAYSKGRVILVRK